MSIVNNCNLCSNIIMFEVIILVIGLTIGAGPEKTNVFIDSSIKTVKETTETVIQKTKEIAK